MDLKKIKNKKLLKKKWTLNAELLWTKRFAKCINVDEKCCFFLTTTTTTIITLKYLWIYKLINVHQSKFLLSLAFWDSQIPTDQFGNLTHICTYENIQEKTSQMRHTSYTRLAFFIKKFTKYTLRTISISYINKTNKTSSFMQNNLKKIDIYI